MAENRMPPQNIEAEKAVLGAMLIKKDAIIEVQEMLRPEDFYREAHKVAYEAMLKLTDNEEAVDIVTLTEELRKEEQLEVEGFYDMVTDQFLLPLCVGAKAVSQIHNMAKKGDYLVNPSLHVAIPAGLMGEWLRWPVDGRKIATLGYFKEVGFLWARHPLSFTQRNGFRHNTAIKVEMSDEELATKFGLK